MTETSTITETPTPTETPFSLSGQVLTDVTYCTMNGLEQKLDVYLPGRGGPWPTVIYIHGGGWTSGNKTEGRWVGKWLAPHGFAVVSVDYRLYPSVRFPAFIEDTKCAIRFLRANAAQYNLDPNRFAVWGTSAGGYLAALAGTADESAGWDVGEYTDQSSRVQAVVDIVGPADLTIPETSRLEQTIKLAFDPDPANRAVSSPVTYATSDDPPMLIVHGDRDDTVDLVQAQAMQKAMKKAHAPSKLVIVKNAGHSLTSANGNAIIPSYAELLQIILSFLKNNLN